MIKRIFFLISLTVAITQGAAGRAAPAANAPMSVKELVARLSSTDRRKLLDAPIGRALRIGEKVPMRFIELKPARPQWEGKICALAYDGDSIMELGAPRSLIVMEKAIKVERVMTISHYQFDLEGRLIGAYLMDGKLDEHGRGVAGSAQETRLDVADASVVKAAQAELGFWLSGKYKEYPDTTPHAPTGPLPIVPVK